MAIIDRFRRIGRPAWADVSVLLAGALLPLAYAPVSFYPLAVLAPAWLFLLWRTASPRRALWRGFLFGAGQFGVGVSWLYIALHRFGEMDALLAVPMLALLVAFLAGYPALVGWLQARIAVALRAQPGAAGQGLLLVPALWVLAEWTRGWFLTGFPWLDLGYSQIDGPVAGYAPWLGIYGVSLAVAVSAALLAALLRDRSGWRYGAGLAAVWLGGVLAGQPAWVVPDGAPIRAALVQGNVDLDKKWSSRYRTEIVERYTRLTLEQRDVDLVVWPEAALPAMRDELDEGYLTQLAKAAADRHMDILLGVLEQEKTDEGRTYYNTVLNVRAPQHSYRKHHLVPFGEYLPMHALMRWLRHYWYIPMSDFTAGAAGQTGLRVGGRDVGVSICYEDAFADEVMRALPQASLLVNVSEDAWYGDSWAPHQHHEIARMRALESGRPMLRATNTGISALIDHRGRVLARAPQFAAYVLRGTVQPMRGVTPYVYWGNLPIIAGTLLMVAVAAWRMRRTTPWPDG